MELEDEIGQSELEIEKYRENLKSYRAKIENENAQSFKCAILRESLEKKNKFEILN